MPPKAPAPGVNHWDHKAPPKAQAPGDELVIIDGQKYDKELIALAKKFSKSGSDGGETITLDEAKQMWQSALDGKKVTVIERKTLQYVIYKLKVDPAAKTFLLAKLGFEEIKGIRYDADLLKVARSAMKDGSIELPEAKKLWKSAMDGKKVTPCESKTLRYIIAENSITDEARQYLADKMGLVQIKGKWYEKDLLEIAKASMKDNKIVLAEAKKIWQAAMDGKKVTQIEANTLRYIIGSPEYNVLEDAKKFLMAQIKEAIALILQEEGELEAEPWMMNLDEGAIWVEDDAYDHQLNLERAASPKDPLAKLCCGLRGTGKDYAYVMKIIQSNGIALAYCPAEFRADHDMVMEAVKRNGLALKYAAPALKNNKKIVVAAVKNHPLAIRYAGSDILAERINMIEVVQIRGSALSHVAKALRADRELVIEAVKSDGLALEYAAEDLKADREVVMEAVKSKGYALQYAPDDFKADRELVLEAVKSNGSALEFAADELKGDRDFAMEAVQCKAYALMYVEHELKKDKEIVLEACRLDPFAQEFAAKELRDRLVLEKPPPQRMWCIHTRKYI